jgi:hypothetical protein
MGWYKVRFNGRPKFKEIYNSHTHVEFKLDIDARDLLDPELTMLLLQFGDRKLCTIVSAGAGATIIPPDVWDIGEFEYNGPTYSYDWVTGVWTPEDTAAEIQTRTVGCRRYGSDGTEKDTSEIYCPLPKPDTSRLNPNFAGPDWYLGAWEPADDPFAQAQTRVVECRANGGAGAPATESLCPQPRPDTERTNPDYVPLYMFNSASPTSTYSAAINLSSASQSNVLGASARVVLYKQSVNTANALLSRARTTLVKDTTSYQGNLTGGSSINVQYLTTGKIFAANKLHIVALSSATANCEIVISFQATKQADVILTIAATMISGRITVGESTSYVDVYVRSDGVLQISPVASSSDLSSLQDFNMIVARKYYTAAQLQNNIHNWYGSRIVDASY